ncbi:unnamed protein product [Lampetra fluviatilis]
MRGTSELPFSAVIPVAKTTRLPGAILPTEGMAWSAGAIWEGTRDDAKEAYPHMDRTALDSLAVEMLLSLAQELRVVLTITEDDELTSLKVARWIQAHKNMQQRPKVAAWTGDAETQGPKCQGGGDGGCGERPWAAWEGLLQKADEIELARRAAPSTLESHGNLHYGVVGRATSQESAGVLIRR